MADVREITPPLTDEHLEQVAREINPDARLIRVKRASRRGPVGMCYWNVAVRTQDQGGSPVYGWVIMQWPKRYTVALHHAVWHRPDGELLDVTDPQSADQVAKKTLFLPDDRFEVPLDRSPLIDNRHFDIPGGIGNPVKQAYLRSQALRREAEDILWQSGLRGEHCFAASRRERYAPPREVLERLRRSARYAAITSECVSADRAVAEIVERMVAEDSGH